MEKLKWLIENTNLFIQTSSTNPNIVSDWGRATKIDLEKQTVHFNRADILRRRGVEGSGYSDAFLRTEAPLSEMRFEVIRNYSQDDGSWQRYEMNNFNGQSWGELYEHVHQIEKDSHWLERLKKCLRM